MNQNDSPFRRDSEEGLSVLLWFCRGFSFSMEIFLRKGFGSRYVESNALWVILLIPCYCMLFDFRRCETMLVFYQCSFMMLIYHRIMRFRWFSRRSSAHVHSYYTGSPRLLRKNSKRSEVRFKYWDEPIIVLMCGIALLMYCEEPFSWFITISGICMLINGTLLSRMQNNEIVNIRDAMLDQQMLAKRLSQRR